MNGLRGRNLDPEKETFLRKNLYTMSPKAIHEATGVSYYTIYKRLKGKTPVPINKPKEVEVVKKIERPPAVYSNTRNYEI